MKKLFDFRYVAMMLLMSLLSLSFSSCSDDDDDFNVPKELVGTWSGSVTTSQTGTVRELMVTFYDDGTGSLQYSSSVYYRLAEFSFNMSGSIITCNGVMAGEDGVANEFTQKFEFNGTSLKPIGMYSEFTLRK